MQSRTLDSDRGLMCLPASRFNNISHSFDPTAKNLLRNPAVLVCRQSDCEPMTHLLGIMTPLPPGVTLALRHNQYQSNRMDVTPYPSSTR